MSLQDIVYDVADDIDKLCPQSTKHSFQVIVDTLWIYEARLEQLQSRYQTLVDAIQIVNDEA